MPFSVILAFFLLFFFLEKLCGWKFWGERSEILFIIQYFPKIFPPLDIVSSDINKNFAIVLRISSLRREKAIWEVIYGRREKVLIRWWNWDCFQQHSSQLVAGAMKNAWPQAYTALCPFPFEILKSASLPYIPFFCYKGENTRQQ